MPKKLERELRHEAKEKGFGKARTDRYVFGTLRNLGWTPGGRKSGKKHHRRGRKR